MLKKITQTVKGVRDGDKWQKEFGPLAPRAGDQAPDFTLSDVNGGNPIRLSEFVGERPVALVFGSFT